MTALPVAPLPTRPAERPARGRPATVTALPAAGLAGAPVEPFSPGRPTARRVAGRPLVVALDDPRAQDATLTGDRAARLAQVAGHGLPVRPGVVLTSEAAAHITTGRPWPVAVSRAVWRARQDLGAEPLLVSASTASDPFGERGDRIHVDPLGGLLALVVAVDRVLASLGDERDGAAVLIQTWPAAERAGVARLVPTGAAEPVVAVGATRPHLARHHRRALQAAIEDVHEATGGRAGLRFRIVAGELDLVDVWSDTTAGRRPALVGV